MDDIEDMKVSLREVSPAASVVVPRFGTAAAGCAGEAGKPSDFVPGTQTIYMKTFGCSHNVSDSEYMQGMLGSYGYRFTEEKESADLWMVNSCTVKDPSQSAFMHLVQRAKTEGRPLVVSGCVPQADRKLKGLEHVSVVGIQQIDRVLEVVEETLKGHVVRLLAKKSLPRLDLPKIRRNELVEIVPLSTGCLGACTYCKTRHARGKLGSYSLAALEGRVGNVLGEVQEVWLSSEDTGAYGIDLGTDISVLLARLTRLLEAQTRPGTVMLRVGMTNPPYILQHVEAVARVLNHPSVFAFLHVPVQSGSTAVLGAMNREYTADEFRQVADALLDRVPGMVLATDIICGFPTETEADFDETLELVRQYRFPVVNISQFYPRPGTPAAKMKRLPTATAKDRSRRLTRLFESYLPYRWLSPVGTRLLVWVGSEVSSDGRHTVGHSKAYYKVLIDRNDKLVGGRAIVQVVSVAKFHVVAQVLRAMYPPVGKSASKAKASSATEMDAGAHRDQHAADLQATDQHAADQAMVELFLTHHPDGRCRGDLTSDPRACEETKGSSAKQCSSSELSGRIQPCAAPLADAMSMGLVAERAAAPVTPLIGTRDAARRAPSSTGSVAWWSYAAMAVVFAVMLAAWLRG